VTTLLAQEHYATWAAADGHALIERLHPPWPDLIVLDVILPGDDGLTLCRHIRQLPVYLPVLMLSVRDEVVDRVTGLEYGADDYLGKPFDPRALLARVRALLRLSVQMQPADRGAEPSLWCGPLHLWRRQHRVTVNGWELQLTAREWALLDLLMTHPGKVFGRTTLFQRLWGADFLGETRCVDVLVQRLRAKLEAHAPGTLFIETVRGFGYRWLPPVQPGVLDHR
jgi:DNA-binding response OmpR family regulator